MKQKRIGGGLTRRDRGSHDFVKVRGKKMC